MFEFFVSGRTELCGNHTDHQGGCVLGCTTEQGMTAFAKPNGTDTVHIESDGFDSFDIEIGDTEPRVEEVGSPAALVRGITECFIESGNIFGGFDAKITSDIPVGSGLSSSAAFEVLIGKIISGLFFENSVPLLRLAQFGRYSENNFFGKPCGLMDQLICANEGIVFADFFDEKMPSWKNINFDFSKSGYCVAIIDCGADHADLTDDYTKIVKDMSLVAWNMGHTVLSEADAAEFIAQFPILRQKCGERAVMRALHFYEENQRVTDAADALERNNIEDFLRIYRESAESSEEKLKNIISENEPEHRLKKAIVTARNFLGTSGGVRVHGGGFAGSAQAIVPTELAESFAEHMENAGFGVIFVL